MESSAAFSTLASVKPDDRQTLFHIKVAAYLLFYGAGYGVFYAAGYGVSRVLIVTNPIRKKCSENSFERALICERFIIMRVIGLKPVCLGVIVAVHLCQYPFSGGTKPPG
ncbi:MAG: hypothetical protein AAFN68_11935, partial [Pseudomonadota bacterium]